MTSDDYPTLGRELFLEARYQPLHGVGRDGGVAWGIRTGDIVRNRRAPCRRVEKSIRRGKDNEFVAFIFVHLMVLLSVQYFASPMSKCACTVAITIVSISSSRNFHSRYKKGHTQQSLKMRKANEHPVCIHLHSSSSFSPLCNRSAHSS